MLLIAVRTLIFDFVIEGQLVKTENIYPLN